MAFVCNECGRTWPDKDNCDPPKDDVYGSLDGICPECDEDDEDDGPRRPSYRPMS